MLGSDYDALCPRSPATQVLRGYYVGLARPPVITVPIPRTRLDAAGDSVGEGHESHSGARARSARLESTPIGGQ